MRRTTFAALALAVCAVASACNSTNRLGLAEKQRIAETALGAGDDVRIDLKTGKPVAAGGGGTSATGASGSSAGSRAGAAGGGSTGSGPGATGVGGGSTAAAGSGGPPVKVGFIVIKGGDALVSNGLGTPVSFGDGKKQVGALVKDLNARGGVLGRKVEPHIYEWNVADANDSPAVGCVKLTEDDHVFAILTVVNLDEEMIACAYKHKTILVNASFGAGDKYLAKQYGSYFFSPSLLHLDAQKTILLSSLKANGYLKGAKVGIAILGGDDQQYQRVTNSVLVPTLKAWKVPYETYVMTSDADVSGAVLRFSTDNVNLVIFSSSSAIPPLLFMRQADSQGFSTRYGLSDSDDSTTLGEYGPRSQTTKIVGSGSLPISNVAVSQYPQSATEKRCLAVMQKGGENDTNRRTNLTAEPYCEALWEFETVSKHVKGALTTAAWQAAFPTVGKGYPPVTAMATNFANGRHDNAAMYRDFYWKTGCACVAYRGALKAIP